MPYYEFKCPACQHKFQVKQGMLTNHTAACPDCGAEAQRVYSRLQWIWSGNVFRPDGSLRQDKDYEILKG